MAQSLDTCSQGTWSKETEKCIWMLHLILLFIQPGTPVHVMMSATFVVSLLSWLKVSKGIFTETPSGVYLE